MAACGGQVPGKKTTAKINSEEHTDYHCCVCEKKNIKRNAEHYCVSCHNYYCEICVKIHDDVPSLSQHVIFDKSNFQRGDQLRSVPNERCADHPKTIVDMYCKTHKEAGCGTCMSTKHDASCVKLYIPANINILFDIENIKHTEQQLRDAIQKVEFALTARESCLKKVLKVTDDAEKQLEIYTERLIKTIKTLEQETRDRVHSIRTELKSVITEQTGFLEKDLAAAKDILQKTVHANFESSNKAQKIACSSLASTITKKCLNDIRGLKCPDIAEISFEPHVACIDLFKDLLKYQSLGEFSRLPSGTKRVRVCYKILRKMKTSVKTTSDKRESWIPGSCTLHDGTILLADYNNKCLKRILPRTTSVSDCLKLPGRPWSLALINQSETAVSLPDQKQVQIIALHTSMKPIKTLNFNSKCYGIAHNKYELFISEYDIVNDYTLAGKLLRRFSRDNMGQPLFSVVHNMAVSGRMLFVADYNKGLIAIEMETGRLLWRYTGADLVCATGVCVDGKGGVFACGCGTNNALHFSEIGDKVGEILTEADGIVNPSSVHIVTETSTLVVTQRYNEYAMQFQLTAR